jgi:hypothetical protein
VTVVLEERERARLIELTNCDADAIDRIIAAAAAEHLVVVLLSFHVAGDFAGWDVFAYEGQSKAAHLAEAGAFRALCSAPRPFNAVAPDPRTRLCVGCEARVRGMAQNPASVRAYNRGEAPRPLTDSPVPPSFRKAAPPAEEAPSRRAPRSSAARTAPPVRKAEAPAPPPPPAPEPEPVEPSLFDSAPVATPRARPDRPF